VSSRSFEKPPREPRFPGVSGRTNSKHIYSLPEKLPSQKERLVFQLSFFRYVSCSTSGRVWDLRGRCWFQGISVSLESFEVRFVFQKDWLFHRDPYNLVVSKSA